MESCGTVCRLFLPSWGGGLCLKYFDTSKQGWELYGYLGDTKAPSENVGYVDIWCRRCMSSSMSTICHSDARSQLLWTLSSDIWDGKFWPVLHPPRYDILHSRIYSEEHNSPLSTQWDLKYCLEHHNILTRSEVRTPVRCWWVADKTITRNALASKKKACKRECWSFLQNIL